MYKLPPIPNPLPPIRMERRRNFERGVANDRKAQRALEWLTSTGKFAPVDGKSQEIVAKGHNDFTRSVLQGYHAWGSLTPKQMGAITSAFDAAYRKFVVAPEMKEAAKDTKFFGETGQRHTLSLTVTAAELRTSIRGERKYFNNRAVDADGNTFTHTSPLSWTVGDKITLTATIKAHRRVKGVACTRLDDVELKAARKRRVLE